MFRVKFQAALLKVRLAGLLKKNKVVIFGTEGTVVRLSLLPTQAHTPFQQNP